MQGQDMFSSEEAVEGQYKNLEQRAYGQDTEDVDKTQKSMRIRTWQKKALVHVGNKSASNVSEVSYAAYQIGAKKMREVVDREEVNQLIELVTLSVDIVGHKGGDRDDINTSLSRVTSDGIEDPNKEHGKLECHETFYLKSSVVSEIKDTYEENSGFGPWIHRSLISIGFLESESLPDNIIGNSEEVADNIRDAYDTARRDVEDMLRDFVTDNVFYWAREGIHMSRIELIEDSVTAMKTNAKEDVEDAVQYLEENAEIIEDTE